MSITHTGIRIYIFDCTFNEVSWVTDSVILNSRIQNAFLNISNFSYNQIKIANVKNSTGSNVEIEVLGVSYNSKTNLTATEIDDLIDDLNSVLLNVEGLSFLKIDICSDIFREDPTSNWPDSSWKRG